MADFGALWVGGPLTKIQVLSLSSFLYYGHRVTLFLYDNLIEVPPGIIKKDAREILPEDSIFLIDGSYAGFSDLFRYQMIQKTGLIWTDVDNICLSKKIDIKDGFCVGYELAGHNEWINGAILGLPQNSDILQYLINVSTSFDKSKMVWAEIGPELVTKSFNIFPYKQYVQPVRAFYPVHFDSWKILWEPTNIRKFLRSVNSSSCLSIYNHMAKRAGIDRNNLPEGSVIQFFYNKFVK